jgi:hypothetical protein
MSYVVLAVLFPPGVQSRTAQRILKRMRVVPIQNGGRRQDNWIQYFIAEPKIAKNREEIAFGGLRLIIGTPK